MTFVRVYLAIYFLLLVGAVVTLWQADILTHVPVLWLAAGLALAVGLGVVLGLTSRRRPAKLE
jgi:formate-dependent nitrite reductase membrane component NrfD